MNLATHLMALVYLVVSQSVLYVHLFMLTVHQVKVNINPCKLCFFDSVLSVMLVSLLSIS